MAKKANQNQPAHDQEPDRLSELVPIKVKRSTYRLVKMAAAWFDMSIMDYLDQIAKRAVSEDLKGIAQDIQGEVERLSE